MARWASSPAVEIPPKPLSPVCEEVAARTTQRKPPSKARARPSTHQSAKTNPHFFVPGNLRDSTYSGISAFSDRTSFAPPRSSIASTIFGGGKQQVLTPDQTVMRAKPTMVSVKSGASAPGTPPVPSIDFDRFNPSKTLRPQSAASNFSVGSTFLNNANTVTQARAQVVRSHDAAEAYSWKPGETVAECCEIQSGSGKCHRCAGRNGACVDMPQKYRNDCLALAQEIASANPDLNRIKALQITCRKTCRDVPSRPIVATTRITRLAATAPKHRLLRAREILAAQVQLDVAN